MRKPELEILVSTMNRSELSFLEPMFPGGEFSEFNILIVNQTSEHNILESNSPNIRVLNCFEYGLSKSRNLAIKNSIGEIALIADDDVVYLPGFEKKIIEAFKKYPGAALITFQFLGKDELPKKNYNNNERKIDSLKNEPDLSSVELALRPEIITKNKVSFNEHFGLGAEFPSGEETLFLKEALNKGLEVYHVPQLILSHPGETTGSRQGSEKYIRGVSALKYLKYGKLGKISLMRLVYLSVKNKHIPPKKAFWAYKTGLRAIRESKRIFKHNNPFK